MVSRYHSDNPLVVIVKDNTYLAMVEGEDN